VKQLILPFEHKLSGIDPFAQKIVVNENFIQVLSVSRYMYSTYFVDILYIYKKPLNSTEPNGILDE
jgi:hypothetical protein